MKATNEINVIDCVVKKHIMNTNRKLKTLEGSSQKLFGAVKSAINAFGDDKKAVKLYRKGLKTNHRSTISIMIRVAKNEFIREHESNLPNSYQTLNEIIKLISELEKTDENSFTSLIEKGQIHSKMTKADMIVLRKEIKEQNNAITYKTVNYDKSPVIKIVQTNEKISVKVPELEELDNFVLHLNEAKRRKLFELLQETQNENKEVA